MTQIIVDIADMKISDNPEDTLVTYALGSCIGVAIYDPIVQVGGMAHFMLPLSKLNPEKAEANPLMFVDTGMYTFLNKLFECGVKKSQAIVSVAGGAKIADNNNFFKIGDRNYSIFKKILWKNRLMVAQEDVGKNHSRTIYLSLATGAFSIKSTAKGVMQVVEKL